MSQSAMRRPMLSRFSALVAMSAAVGGLAFTSPEQAASVSVSRRVQPVTDSTEVSAMPDPRVGAARMRLEIAAAEHRVAQARIARAARESVAEQRRVSRASERVRLINTDPKRAARAMLGRFGWGAGQFACLESLWQKESGWNPRAQNPSSGAFGIPQALPGSKMASAGSDWRTSPVTQIRWGLGYISDVYGSPCSALGQSQAKGWY